jgi:hypothetical protein
VPASCFLEKYEPKTLKLKAPVRREGLAVSNLFSGISRSVSGIANPVSGISSLGITNEFYSMF